MSDQKTGEVLYQLNGIQKEKAEIFSDLKAVVSLDANQLLQIGIDDRLPASYLLSVLKDLADLKWNRVRIDGLLEGRLLDFWKPSELLSIEEDEPAKGASGP